MPGPKVYLLAGKAQDLYVQSKYPAYEESNSNNSEACKNDLIRLSMIGSKEEKDFFREQWRHYYNDKEYTQGHMDATNLQGIGESSFVPAFKKLKEKNPDQKPPSIVGIPLIDKKEHPNQTFPFFSALTIYYLEENPHVWMIGLYRNTLAPNADKEICILCSNAPEAWYGLQDDRPINNPFLPSTQVDRYQNDFWEQIKEIDNPFVNLLLKNIFLADGSLNLDVVNKINFLRRIDDSEILMRFLENPELFNNKAIKNYVDAMPRVSMGNFSANQIDQLLNVQSPLHRQSINGVTSEQLLFLSNLDSLNALDYYKKFNSEEDYKKFNSFFSSLDEATKDRLKEIFQIENQRNSFLFIYNIFDSDNLKFIFAQSNLAEYIQQNQKPSDYYKVEKIFSTLRKLITTYGIVNFEWKLLVAADCELINFLIDLPLDQTAKKDLIELFLNKKAGNSSPLAEILFPDNWKKNQDRFYIYNLFRNVEDKNFLLNNAFFTNEMILFLAKKTDLSLTYEQAEALLNPDSPLSKILQIDLNNDQIKLLFNLDAQKQLELFNLFKEYAAITNLVFTSKKEVINNFLSIINENNIKILEHLTPEMFKKIFIEQSSPLYSHIFEENQNYDFLLNKDICNAIGNLDQKWGIAELNWQDLTAEDAQLINIISGLNNINYQIRKAWIAHFMQPDNKQEISAKFSLLPVETQNNPENFFNNIVNDSSNVDNQSKHHNQSSSSWFIFKVLVAIAMATLLLTLSLMLLVPMIAALGFAVGPGLLMVAAVAGPLSVSAASVSGMLVGAGLVGMAISSFIVGGALGVSAAKIHGFFKERNVELPPSVPENEHNHS